MVLIVMDVQSSYMVQLYNFSWGSLCRGHDAAGWKQEGNVFHHRSRKVVAIILLAGNRRTLQVQKRNNMEARPTGIRKKALLFHR